METIGKKVLGALIKVTQPKAKKIDLFAGENHLEPVEPSPDDIIKIYKRLEDRKERKIK